MRALLSIDESDRWHNQPLHIALIEAARKRGLAGATVTRAIEGYGKHSTIHSTHLLELSSDLPIVVTIIDREEVMNNCLPLVNGLSEPSPLAEGAGIKSLRRQATLREGFAYVCVAPGFSLRAVDGKLLSRLGFRLS